MADSGSQKIYRYMADTKDVQRKMQQLRRMNEKLAQTMGKSFAGNLKTVGQGYEKISKAGPVKNLDKSFADLNGTTTKTSKVFKDVDGKYKQLTTTTKVYTKNVKGQEKVQSRTSNTVENLSKSTSSLGTNLKRLASRAALTIPVWFALRGAFTGTFRVIAEGTRLIAEQDKAFQKAKRNISGTTGSIAKNTQRLRKEILQLSIDTGVSVTEITNSFQKFATVGFDFETSLEATKSAVKTSILLFGEAEDTANAFARSLRVLVDRSDSTKSAGQQISEAMALTSELWKSNAFELNEFTQSLEKFAGTAKTTNITTKETISLLSTLSTAGLRQRGGRLLRTSINKLLGNLDKLSSTLNIDVNPNLDSTFSVLVKVINELQRLQATTGTLGPVTQTMGEIFGGVRGAEVVRALIAMREELEKNMAITGDLTKFNREFKNQNEQIHQLARQFSNLNVEMKKAFVTGLYGANDYQGALQDVVETQKALHSQTENFGKAIRDAVLGSIAGTGGGMLLTWLRQQDAIEETAGKVDILNNRIQEALINDVSLVEFQSIIDKLKEVEDIEPFGGPRTFDALKTGFEKETERIKKQINTAINDGLIINDLEKLNKQLKGVGAEILDIDEEQLNKFKTKVRETLKESAEEAKFGEAILSPQQTSEINKSFIKSNIDQLKAQGALTSEAIQRRTELEKIFGIKQDAVTLVERELAKERELTEEKRLQSELGSQSMKLFRIAQEEGTEVARRIGKVLSGDLDIDIFKGAGGRAVEVFEKRFSDLNKQQQALKFFTEGRGQSINIREEGIRGLPSKTSAIMARDRAVRKALPAKQVTQNVINNQISAPVKIDVNIDASSLDEVADQVEEKIADKLPRVGSKIYSGLNKAMFGTQNGGLI